MKSLASLRRSDLGLLTVPAPLLKAVFALALSIPLAAHSDQEPSGETDDAGGEEVRIYSSVEERREAGRGRKIADWLTVSGLVEVEIGRQRDKVRNGNPDLRDDVFVSSIQLGMEAELSDSLKAEVLFDAEWDDGHRSVLDEAFVTLDADDWEFEAGRLYLPFGRYYSHFVSGPLLDFGETRGTALSAKYSLSESVGVNVFVFDGEAESSKKESDALNWGFGVDLVSESRSVRAGASYLADLTDAADVSHFDFDNSGRNRVGGVAGYLLIGAGSFELSAEFIRSSREFAAFDPAVNQPTAVNLELVYAPGRSLLYALRFEHSDELPDEPKNQLGVAATWRVSKYASVSAEYLVGRYKDGFVFDDGGNPLSMRRQFTIQISAEF